MVDAQAVIAPEAEHAIVPPRERSFGLREFPERIVQAEAGQLAERRAFRFAGMGYTTGWGLRARLWWAQAFA